MSFKAVFIAAAIWSLALTGPANASAREPQNVLNHEELDDLENSIGLLGLLGLIGLFGLRRADRRC